MKANKEQKTAIMNECMTEKVYEAVSQNQLPLDVKRKEFPNLHWRAKRIASQLRK